MKCLCVRAKMNKDRGKKGGGEKAAKNEALASRATKRRVLDALVQATDGKVLLSLLLPLFPPPPKASIQSSLRAGRGKCENFSPLSPSITTAGLLLFLLRA